MFCQQNKNSTDDTAGGKVNVLSTLFVLIFSGKSIAELAKIMF